MKIAFKNIDTGQIVKHFRFVANHIYRIEYTDNLQDAWLYEKYYFEGPPSIDKEETHMQYQLRWCKERHNQNIVPFDVLVTLP